jgi:hypothetical protein
MNHLVTYRLPDGVIVDLFQYPDGRVVATTVGPFWFED